MEYYKGDDITTCPYDSTHKILRTRLSFHILRCSKSHKDVKLATCPFDSSHMVKEEHLEDHIERCKAGAKHRNREITTPVCRQPRHPEIDVAEDWDQEPPQASYDPDKYCLENPITRRIYGEPRAVRRKFRDEERVRVQQRAENRKK